MEENEEINETNTIDDSEATESAFYELSYHMIPTLSEEDANAEIASIKEVITKSEGKVLAEGPLEIFELAYDISKTYKSVKTNYDRSYFGWVKFSTLPQNVAELKTFLDASASAMRYLMIRIDKDEVEPKVKEVKEKKAKAVEGEVVVESDLDKTIDELVIS